MALLLARANPVCIDSRSRWLELFYRRPSRRQATLCHDDPKRIKWRLFGNYKVIFIVLTVVLLFVVNTLGRFYNHKAVQDSL